MPGKDTFEYKTLSKNQAALADQLGDSPGVALRLANALLAIDVIGKANRDSVDIRGPHVTEIMRAQPLFTAMLAKIDLNPQRYYQLRDTMLLPEVGVDSDVVDAYMPKGKMILQQYCIECCNRGVG